MPIQLIRTLAFCAAHCMPEAPDERARRVHGHLYAVDLILEGEIDPDRGWLIDFGQIKQAFAPISAALDHAYLNEIEGLEAGDRESIAQWILRRLKPALPALRSVRVRLRIEPRFSPTRVSADPSLDLPERIMFGLETAHRLPRCGVKHRCRNLHGHSLRIEIGADNLDALEKFLPPLHERLDYRLLNEIEGLENPTAENLAVWLWRALQPDVADLRVVVVRESPQCACIYRGK